MAMKEDYVNKVNVICNKWFFEVKKWFTNISKDMLFLSELKHFENQDRDLQC